MLRNLAEVMAAAAPGAIGSFNVLDLDMARAIVTAAESQGAPVVIGVASRHFAAADAPALVPALRALLERSPVPAALHLDHAGPDQLDMIRAALELGFTSIMIDGSHLPFEANVAVTAEVVRLARPFGASVEGELGGIAGEEGVADTGSDAPEALPYTDPTGAAVLVRRSGIDALAIACGTAHGIYKEAPRISFETIAAVAAAVPVPLVLHGATGVPDADLRETVRLGIRKINFFSGLLASAMDEVRASAGDTGNDFLAFKRRLDQAWRELAGAQIALYASPKSEAA